MTSAARYFIEGHYILADDAAAGNADNNASYREVRVSHPTAEVYNLAVDSDRPYSGRETCGGCHDINLISNGMIHQQGRTDAAGNIVMKDDFFDDGRW